MAKVAKTEGCWNWIGAIGTHGYGRIGFENKTMQAHRASWMIFRGGLTDAEWVLHRCDNRKCVNPEHLFLGDRTANVRDCIKKRRHAHGESSGLSRLTKENVIEIRRWYATGRFRQATLAGFFGVDQTTIHYIVKGKTWKEAL